MVQSLATKLVMAARAAGYRELIVKRSIVLTMCPKCNRKRVIRFRKTAGGKVDKMIDRCWGCDYKAWVGDIVDITKDPMLCPCGCGDLRPSRTAKYAHGKVCAARLKDKLSKKAVAVENPDGSASFKGKLVGMGL